MPARDAVHVSQRPLSSPAVPSQCQPSPALYQATQPRVEIGISELGREVRLDQVRAWRIEVTVGPEALGLRAAPARRSERK